MDICEQEAGSAMRLTDRIQKLKQLVRAGEHKKFRHSNVPDVLNKCESEGLSWPRRMSRLTRRLCEAEKAVIIGDERIVSTRTVPDGDIGESNRTKN